MSKLFLAAAAALVFAGPALAAPDAESANAQTQAVSTRGVNLSDAAQAQQFYIRLQQAARQVCQAGGYRPVSGTEDLTCVRQNMQGAVRAANAPQLTALLDKSYGPDASNARAFATDAR
jgi:UrcA family protein